MPKQFRGEYINKPVLPDDTYFTTTTVYFLLDRWCFPNLVEVLGGIQIRAFVECELYHHVIVLEFQILCIGGSLLSRSTEYNIRAYLVGFVLQELLVDFPATYPHLHPLRLSATDGVLALVPNLSVLESGKRDEEAHLLQNELSLLSSVH